MNSSWGYTESHEKFNNKLQETPHKSSHMERIDWFGLPLSEKNCWEVPWLINPNDCHDPFCMLQSYRKLLPTEYVFLNPLDNSGAYRILRLSIHIYSEVGSDSEVNIMEIPRQHPSLSNTSSIAKKNKKTPQNSCTKLSSHNCFYGSKVWSNVQVLVNILQNISHE